MKLYCLHQIQRFPITIQDAWKFFSDPRNLQQITPRWLDFRITSDVPEKMYAGMILSYKIRMLSPVPMNWITEITHVRDPHFFVDEQRFGPYRFWHHQHIFTEISGGIEMQDIIHYGLSFGIAGRMANHLIVRGKLNKIFAFRRSELTNIFGDIPGKAS